jgi:6-pyruvoyl-tetrahydropterin synthase
MQFRLTKDYYFEAAQTLPCAPEGHKCRKMHGHSFKVEVSVEGQANSETGWVYDHAEISRAMKPLLEGGSRARESHNREHVRVVLAKAVAAVIGAR